MVECTRCGKEVDEFEAYYLALIEKQPEGDDFVWESGYCCSKECYDKSIDRVYAELNVWILEKSIGKEYSKLSRCCINYPSFFNTLEDSPEIAVTKKRKIS